MFDSCIEKETYTAEIDQLKRENLTNRSGGSGCRSLFQFLKAGEIGAICFLLKKRIRSMIRNRNAEGPQTVVSDYFSEEEIAVYTVIFGNYDTLQEPKCCPDNCRFFLISDSIRPPASSVWKRLVLPEKIISRMEGMNDTEKNRYLKMMPHLLFPGFRYSVYLDGNVQLVTDPTEFINHMPECGVAAHRHASLDCVYQEAKHIVLLKKSQKKDIDKVVALLKKEKLPEEYGLPECPVLVRQHDQPECRKMMEEWWELFEKYPYRDQMLLPLVLYRNGIRPDEIDWLGNNVYQSPSFRCYAHLVRTGSGTSPDAQ